MGAAASLVTDDPTRVRRLQADDTGELLLICALAAVGLSAVGV